MNNKLIGSLAAIVATVFSSCHMSIPQDDITIINNTKDTLYYYIDVYRFRAANIRNMAYERVTDEMTNRTIDSIPGYTFNPHDIIHPGKLDTTWKQFASEKGGIAVLFYRKDIEKASAKLPLTAKDVYKRIDLTAWELDSLKYKIVLN